MKPTSVKKSSTVKILRLILCLGALPLLTMVTGCAGDRYHQSTGEAIDDHGTSMRVKSALSDDAEYKYEGVDVKTFKGTVQLSGFVDTHAQKSRAADIAKNVEGVKDVENNISVKE
jgi:hyperosmotically inducible periplasmic protein